MGNGSPYSCYGERARPPSAENGNTSKYRTVTFKLREIMKKEKALDERYRAVKEREKLKRQRRANRARRKELLRRGISLESNRDTMDVKITPPSKKSYSSDTLKTVEIPLNNKGNDPFDSTHFLTSKNSNTTDESEKVHARRGTRHANRRRESSLVSGNHNHRRYSAVSARSGINEDFMHADDHRGGHEGSITHHDIINMIQLPEDMTMSQLLDPNESLIHPQETIFASISPIARNRKDISDLRIEPKAETAKDPKTVTSIVSSGESHESHH
ncbi:hypothetical protein AAMO2058_001159400 [Amorphochlora amoebiformis]